MTGKNDRWDALSIFRIEITSSSPRLYRNGRQPVRLEAAVEPNRGELSEAERRSLRPVDFKRKTPLPEGDDGQSLWYFTRTPNGYDYFPGGPAPAAAPAGEAQPRRREYFDLYVMTRAPAGEKRQIGLELTRDDGTKFYLPEFDEPAELTPEQVPNFLIDAYAFDDDRVDGIDDEWNARFVDNYYLGVTYGSGQHIPLREMTATPAGMVQWHDKNFSETRASYVGYGGPGSETVHYNPAIVLGSTHEPKDRILQPKAGYGTVVLAASDDIPYHSDSANQHNGPCQITALDAFGNEHKLRVSFESTTDRLKLRLHKG